MRRVWAGRRGTRQRGEVTYVQFFLIDDKCYECAASGRRGQSHSCEARLRNGSPHLPKRIDSLFSAIRLVLKVREERVKSECTVAEVVLVVNGEDFAHGVVVTNLRDGLRKGIGDLSGSGRE
eukprot:scaffold4490_cov130-Isochrysis_galbana.AAC.5